MLKDLNMFPFNTPNSRYKEQVWILQNTYLMYWNERWEVYMCDYVSYTEHQMCRCRFLYFIHSFIYFVDFLLGTKKLRGRCNEVGHKNKSWRIRSMTRVQKQHASARIWIMCLDGALYVYRLQYVAWTVWNSVHCWTKVELILKA